MSRLVNVLLVIGSVVIVLLLLITAALGTLEFRHEPYPEDWTSEKTSETVDCGIKPGIYSLSGERVSDDPRYRTPQMSMRFFSKSRHDRPFGSHASYRTADKISLSFNNNNTDEDKSRLVASVFTPDGSCLGSTTLVRGEHYDCRGEWLKRELPHADAEPIVGPHSHAIKLRSRGDYLEVKRTNWMVGFLYIIPGATFGTSWLRFKRTGDLSPSLLCPTE